METDNELMKLIVDIDKKITKIKNVPLFELLLELKQYALNIFKME